MDIVNYVSTNLLALVSLASSSIDFNSRLWLECMLKEWAESDKWQLLNSALSELGVESCLIWIVNVALLFLSFSFIFNWDLLCVERKHIIASNMK